MTETRDIVIPGDIIGDLKEKKSGYGTFSEEGKIISKFLGIPKDSSGYLSVVPLSGVYMPRRQDKIKGEKMVRQDILVKIIEPKSSGHYRVSDSIITEITEEKFKSGLFSSFQIRIKPHSVSGEIIRSGYVLRRCQN